MQQHVQVYHKRMDDNYSYVYLNRGWKNVSVIYSVSPFILYYETLNYLIFHSSPPALEAHLSLSLYLWEICYTRYSVEDP